MGELAQQFLSRTLHRRALQKDLKQQEEALRTVRHHKRRSAATEVFQLQTFYSFVIIKKQQLIKDVSSQRGLGHYLVSSWEDTEVPREDSSAHGDFGAQT